MHDNNCHTACCTLETIADTQAKKSCFTLFALRGQHCFTRHSLTKILFRYLQIRKQPCHKKDTLISYQIANIYIYLSHFTRLPLCAMPPRRAETPRAEKPDRAEAARQRRGRWSFAWGCQGSDGGSRSRCWCWCCCCCCCCCCSC